MAFAFALISKPDAKNLYLNMQIYKKYMKKPITVNISKIRKNMHFT